MGVGVEVLGDVRSSTPVVFKDLGRCFTLPAALCRLIVVIGVICPLTWRASIWLLPLGVSVVWCSTESPVIAVLAARFVGWLAQGCGRVVVEVIDAPRGGVPVRIRWHNTALDMPRTHLPDGDIPGA